LNEIDAIHLLEKKSSLSLTNIENINSISFDKVSKSIETVGPTMTTFDDGKHKSTIL